MERDPTLATIDDITEEEANITIPEVLPSSSGRTTSSSEFSAFAARLQRHRRGTYRKRLSRSMEQISASSSHSAQTSDKEESDDDDSLASCNVFGSQADQIKFLKDSLLQSHKELEQYKILNADLTKKLERCKKHGREVEKMLENVLWEKLKLYNKYKRLQRRFDVPETPPGGWEDSSPSDSSGGPGNGGRAGTPVRGHRKRRGDSTAGHRDGAGPSKRPTTVRCGLDRQMESDSNTSAEEKKELSDSGYYMDDISHSAKSCYQSDADVSSSRSDSRCSHQTTLADQDDNRDNSNDGHSENDVVPSHVSITECSLQSALVDQDISNNPDNSNDAQSEKDVPSHISPSESPDHVNEMNIFDDEVSKDGTVDPDIDDALHDYEDGDVYSRGSRRTSSSENDEQEKRKSPEESPKEEESDESCRSSIPRKRKSSTSLDEEIASDGEEDEERHESSSSTSISRKRPSPSTSPSVSDGDSGGSKRRKSSSPSTDCSGSTSRASSTTSSDSVRRSPSRSPSPPDFAHAPRIIPPVPDGSPEYPRYWTRNGNRTSLRSSVRVNYNDDDYFDFHLKGL